MNDSATPQLKAGRLRRFAIKVARGWSSVERRERPLAGYGPVVGIVMPNGDYGFNLYRRAVERAGGIPVRIPLIADKYRLHAAFRACDALVFAGGQDLDPKLYGESIDPRCEVGTPSIARDQSDLQLIEWAIDAKVPFLGICRGLQLLNVKQGGSLWQDLNRQEVTRADHRIAVVRRHRAAIQDGTLLSRIVKAPGLKVNSFHHQGVKELGDGLRVTAMAPDGVVEGLELSDHPFGVAVQFHPEVLARRKQWAYDLFAHLVDAGRQYGDRAREAEAFFSAGPRYLWFPSKPKEPPLVA